ncbi:MAG: S26 family signal peptidase [Parachlamydiaceae bacterium]
MFFLILYCFDCKVRINLSNSLTNRVLIGKKANEFFKGDIVSFKHPLFKGSLAKIILGVEGDIIKVQDLMVTINDNECIVCRPHMHHGELLTPIQSLTIPKDHYFVVGTHELSFDSRYSYFDLVKKQWIEEKLWPIF